MTKYLFHIISGQLMPVFIANQIVNPHKNIYVVTKDSEKLLSNIVNTINGKNDVIHSGGFDYEDLFEQLRKYCSGFSKEKNTLIFNFTGGTKIQSVAFFEFAYTYGHRAIYINGQNSEIIYFSAGEQVQKRKFSVNISPKKYLALGGFKIESYVADYLLDGPSERYLYLMKNHYSKFYGFIKNKRKNQATSQSKITFDENRTNIELIYENKTYLSVDTDSKIIRHVITPGFWLEYWTFRIIRDSGKFDYVYMNVKIHYKSKNVTDTTKNEIDIWAMKGSTPYIFECKTAAVKNEEIDKLNYLRRTYFGRYARFFFVGLNLPEGRKKEKIEDNNITFVNFSELENFINKLNLEENPSLK